VKERMEKEKKRNSFMFLLEEFSFLTRAVFESRFGGIFANLAEKIPLVSFTDIYV
jgi:hypothetical protein